MKHKLHTERKSFKKWAAPVTVAAPQSFTRTVQHHGFKQTVPLNYRQSIETRVGIKTAFNMSL